MCFTGDESPTVFAERIRRARKEHRCRECRETIPAGAIYTAIFGVWDGERAYFKICSACEELRARIAEHEMARGCAEHESVCPYGGLSSYLGDRLGLGHPFTEARTAFMALPVE